MWALPCSASFLLLSSCLLFLLVRNIQLFLLPVKPFLPVLFLAFPASRCAANLVAVVRERLLGPMLQNKARSATWLVDLLFCPFGCLATGAASDDLADDTSFSAAVCPVVYQLDQSPSSHGYHYSFFGNAFFVNEQGYLLTVAHVLETFRDGGQPYILVSRPNSPPRLLRAAIIAVDPEHDVAVLLATPNPFAGHHKVAFLPLAPEPDIRGPRFPPQPSRNAWPEWLPGPRPRLTRRSRSCRGPLAALQCRFHRQILLSVPFYSRRRRPYSLRDRSPAT